jgi:hypothetical protein
VCDVCLENNPEFVCGCCKLIDLCRKCKRTVDGLHLCGVCYKKIGSPKVDLELVED